jgi:hypothetical protein
LVKKLKIVEKKIFQLQTNQEFEDICFQLFNIHYSSNKTYSNFCKLLGIDKKNIAQIYDIPFLPVEFFKSKKVYLDSFEVKNYFSSSATTGAILSKHYYHSLHLYEKSFFKSFEFFYGDVSNYNFLCLLPSYLEREGSSLIYMANKFIERSNLKFNKSAFFLNNFEELKNRLEQIIKSKEKFILLGVSFALLDFSEKYKIDLSSGIVMETGGMKGRRKELIREELHQLLMDSFNVNEIHSEYGMTELFSQGYSNGLGIYNCPSWMRILIRDNTDPKKYLKNKNSGCINTIDLANMYSCPFISTQDIGKKQDNNSFEVLGRMDQSDVRGCNLMVL